MKYAEFIIDNHIINFYNSTLGIERVSVDEKIVSRKFSFNGTNHNILIDFENLILKSKYELFESNEIKLDLIRHGKIIEKRVVKVDKKQKIYWNINGVVIGVFFYKLINLFF